jgi:TolB protein
MKRTGMARTRGRLGLALVLASALALPGGAATAAAAKTQGRIAFSNWTPERGTGPIYIINPDGSGQTRVRFQPTVKPKCIGGNGACTNTIMWREPAWSPNGKRLALIGTFGNGFLGGDTRVYIRQPGGRTRDVFSSVYEGTGGVSWSPDGMWLAYDRAVDLMDPTPILIRVRTGKAHPLGKSLTGLNATWSPDGSTLAFDGPSGIATVRPDGSKLKPLTRWGGNPDWSPDGKKIAFGSQSIRTVDRDGHVVLLTRVGGNPSWSPDGSRIVFERGNSLWIMDSNGSHQHMLVRNGRAPDWSR